MGMGLAQGTGEQQRLVQQATNARGTQSTWARDEDRDDAWKGYVSESFLLFEPLVVGEKFQG